MFYNENKINKVMNKMKKIIMHVDMDAFFAAVEQNDNDCYKNKPVIVGGCGKRGVVATASYEARLFGVFSAMSIAKAKKLCPEGIFLPCNHNRYSSISKEFFKILNEFSPCVEPLSLDEAFLDLTGMEKIFNNIEDYARKLKSRVYEQLGLVVSVGVGSNKFIAKLASDLEKPNGLVIVKPGQEYDLLKDKPVSILWGVGAKNNQKLKSLGIYKVEDLLKTEFKILLDHFGPSAYKLVDLAQGKDERQVVGVREPQSIGKEATFEVDLVNTAAIKKELLALSEKVGWRLRQKKYLAQKVTLKIKLKNFQVITCSESLVAGTNYDEVIYDIACKLYEQIEVKDAIRLLGITAGKLLKGNTINLFENTDDRKKALYNAIDSLKEKFGETVITKAKLR